MGEMWKIGILRVVGDETVTATDFFDYQRFDDLEEALKRMAAKEGDDHKPGLKLSLGYLLQKAASILKVQRIINGVIDKAGDVDHFICVLKLQWDSILSQPSCNRERQAIKPSKAEEPSTGRRCGKVKTLHSAVNEQNDSRSFLIA